MVDTSLPPDIAAMSFEDALQELEQIVKRLEEGKSKLDDAISSYERGALLTAAGVEHTIEFYPAAHGFAVPDNPPYDQKAAERHWIALQELFETALPN